MRAALIDSSAFYSLQNPDEPDHDRTRRAFVGLVDSRVRLFTTNFVFDETYTLLLVRLGRDAAFAWGQGLRSGRLVQRVRVGDDHEERAWEILRDFADKTFSYTDATSFAVAESLGIDGALSLDRHFHQHGGLAILP